jgi:hypothetical protein
MSDRTALVLDQPTQCCGARILIKALGGGYICPCGKKHKIKRAYPVDNGRHRDALPQARRRNPA